MTWYSVVTLKRQDKKNIEKNSRYAIYSYSSSSRLLMPRGSIVLALWIRWASRAEDTKNGTYQYNQLASYIFDTYPVYVVAISSQFCFYDDSNFLIK